MIHDMEALVRSHGPTVVFGAGKGSALRKAAANTHESIARHAIQYASSQSIVLDPSVVPSGRLKRRYRRGPSSGSLRYELIRSVRRHKDIIRES